MELSQAERDKLTQQLLQQQEQLNAQMMALGISPQGPKSPEKAPDGGPPSFAHSKLKTILYENIEVKLVNAVPGGRQYASIRPEDFDPEVHEHVEKPKRARRELEPEKKPDPKAAFGKQPREELLTMTVSLLQAMPEVEYIKDVPKEKGKLVDAILSVRK